MRNKLAMVAMLTLASAPIILPSAALARHHTYRGQNTYNEQRYRCGGGNGAVGTVAGGAGGALAGNALGGGTLGTIAGGVGGALLGRHFDKQHTRHRNGC
ncbi:MAG: hypothetical protein JWL66_990 [Sphingomonadales bacterium]|nr:hypothetical protein [Sphingomonadales bacterium]